jgi:hypothetical protein
VLGVTLLHRGVALGRIETVLVEIPEIGRLRHRHVVVAIDEQVVVHGFGVVLAALNDPQSTV